KHLFILEHIETGELIQVGKTCVKDFTGGHHNPERIADWYTYLNEAMNISQESFSGSYTEYYYDVLKVVVHSIYFTDKEGYIKAEHGEHSTSYKVKESLSDIIFSQNITDQHRE